jgi:carbonic anhydrase
MKFVAKGGADHPPLHWGYAKNGDDWGIEGEEQSPIDIKTKDAAPLVTHYLKMWWNIQPIKAEVFDNGHTLLCQGAVSRLVGTDDQRNNALYEAVQFHFHGPSEHTIDGKRFPLELHIVHVITAEHFAEAEDEDEEEAPQRHLAVLGILYEIDDTAPPNPFLEALRLDKIGSGEQVELNMFEYFGNIERPEYFSYPGSLTTPPCSEIVNWFVVKKPFTLTSAQLKHFTDRTEFAEFGNNRVVQPIGKRHVCNGNCDYIADYQYNTGDLVEEDLI